eukprot:4121360-Amphidinium_carterae.1
MLHHLGVQSRNAETPPRASTGIKTEKPSAASALELRLASIANLGLQHTNKLLESVPCSHKRQYNKDDLVQPGGTSTAARNAAQPSTASSSTTCKNSYLLT